MPVLCFFSNDFHALDFNVDPPDLALVSCMVFVIIPSPVTVPAAATAVLEVDELIYQRYVLHPPRTQSRLQLMAEGRLLRAPAAPARCHHPSPETNGIYEGNSLLSSPCEIGI